LTRVLLVKTSSLGDVIHCLPAVSDMAAQVKDLRLDWVVEEEFAEIPRLHPAVERAVPVRLRSWRRRLLDLSAWSELSDFRGSIRVNRYDRVIDAQGLIRSAVLARLARGRHCGYNRRSVREPLAAWFYDKRYKVGVTLHAAERMRRLAAAAMGYALPAEQDYGLNAEPRPIEDVAVPYIVGLHGTARPDKAWAEDAWAALIKRAGEAGFTVVLPAGGDRERRRANRIAETAPGVVVPARLGYADLAALFAGAAAVVGVDTGLTHLASAVGAPVVAIYAASWPDFNGVIGPAYVANLGGPGAPPAVDEVWEQTRRAIASGRRTGPWPAEAVGADPPLKGRRRFRPSSNARAVVDRR
jgi:heptosyltransferase I